MNWFNLDHEDDLRQRRIERKLNRLLEENKDMSKEFDELTAQVASNSTVIDSALVLISGIADRIVAAGTDPVKLTALTDELKAKDAQLSEAVLANTPVT